MRRTPSSPRSAVSKPSNWLASLLRRSCPHRPSPGRESPRPETDERERGSNEERQQTEAPEGRQVGTGWRKHRCRGRRGGGGEGGQSGGFGQRGLANHGNGRGCGHG